MRVVRAPQDTKWDKFLKRIRKTEERFGGPLRAYDIEWKIRMFVTLVLMHVFDGSFRIDGEIPIYLFGKKISPDLQVLSKSKDENG